MGRNIWTAGNRSRCEDVAPGVVGILCHRCVLAVQKLDHVALGVQHVVIGVVARLRLVVVPPHQERMAGFVIDEIQRVLEYGIFSRVAVQPVDGFSHDPAVLGHVLMPKPVGNLHAADAGHIVLIGIQVAALGYAAEPAALGPGEVGIIRPVVPVEGVGRVGIGNRASYAVHGDPGELVGPCAVAIGVTDAVLSADDAAKVARGVDGIIDCRGGCGRRGGSGIGVPGLLRKLVQIVVGASNLPWQGEVARSAGGVGRWSGRRKDPDTYSSGYRTGWSSFRCPEPASDGSDRRRCRSACPGRTIRCHRRR